MAPKEWTCHQINDSAWRCVEEASQQEAGIAGIAMVALVAAAAVYAIYTGWKG